ncbi:MAG: NFACT RNA binding domain-containing protein [Deferrisomatales bacterium]
MLLPPAIPCPVGREQATGPVLSPLDAFLLARLGAHLSRLWTGAHVQGVWQDLVGRLVLRLRVPGRTAHLVLSPGPEVPGLGLTRRRPACPPAPPALAAYLRAHAEGGRLEGVRCQPFERAVELVVRRGEGRVRVVLEAIGRWGMLLALDSEGRVRAASRWGGAKRSTLRPLEPGAPYRPPPAPGKARPDRVLPAEITQWTAQGEPLHRRILGLSPALSAEVLHRRTAGSSDWGAFVSVREAYGRPGPVWEYTDGLSAVELTGRGAPRAVHQPGESLYRAGSWLEEELGRVRAAAARHRRERQEIAFRERLERRQARIRDDLDGLPDIASLKHQAEALGAHLYRVTPGAPWADVPDPHDPNRTWRICLDPALGPGGNLDRLYGRVRRARAARAALEARLEETRCELVAGLPSSGEAPPPDSRQRPSQRETFRRFVSSDGWAIWVGRNGAENDRLLREARPWDLWLHAREGPGAHVLLRKPGRESRPPDRTLAEAAGLAAQHSRRRGDAGVDVMVAEVARVRRAKGGGKGRVLVSGERTLWVTPGAGSPRPAPGPVRPGGPRPGG